MAAAPTAATGDITGLVGEAAEYGPRDMNTQPVAGSGLELVLAAARWHPARATGGSSRSTSPSA